MTVIPKITLMQEADASSNGAWLIANSYGSDYNDNGYFWVSYEEPSLSDIYTMAAESTANYENIYQYDGNGWSNGTASQAVILPAQMYLQAAHHLRKL